MPPLAALIEEARRDPPNPGNAEERLPDEGNADRLARFLASDRPVVVYFGKLIEQKGVHVLSTHSQEAPARLVVVGFGPEREALERRAADRGVETLFTGPLEHRHLGTCSRLLTRASCRRSSPRPSAWSRPRPPLPVARRSSPATRGWPRSRQGSRSAYPPAFRHLAAFDSGDAGDLARRLGELLALPPADRAAIRSAARAAVVEHWSWAGVSRRLLEPFT